MSLHANRVQMTVASAPGTGASTLSAATRAHILARYPEWRQINLLAGAVEQLTIGGWPE